MADVPVLELQIKDNSEKAIQGLKSLAASLSSLKTSLSGGIGLEGISASLDKLSQKFAATFSNETVNNITKVSDALDKIAQAGNAKLPDLSKFQNDVNKSAEQLNMQPVTSGISEIGAAISSAAPELSAFSGQAGAVDSAVSSIASSVSVATKETENLGRGAKTATSSVRNHAASLKDLKKSTDRLISPLDRLINRFGRLMVFRILRNVIKQIGEAFKEGITNVRAYSKEIGGSFHKAMSGAEDALLKLKNTLGAALAPAFEALIPVMHTVVSWFIELVNYVNQFVSLLTGKGTWTKAIDVSAEEFEKTKKTVQKADKEVKNLLADFDELNIIQSESGGRGGSGGKVDTTEYATMFEEVGQFDERIRKIIDWLHDNMDQVRKIAGLIGTALLGWRFSTAFTNVLGTLGGLVAAGALIAITWDMVQLFDGKYIETKDIGWLVGDVLTTALGTLATKTLIDKVIGEGTGSVAAAITLAVSATATVKSVLGAVDVSALSKESVLSLIVAAVKYGAAGVFVAKSLNSFGMTAFSTGDMLWIGGGVALATFGAAIGIKAVIQEIETGDATEETLMAKAISSLTMGLGAGIIGKKIFNLTAGESIAVGAGVSLVTFGALIGIKAYTEAIKSGTTEEELLYRVASSLSMGAGAGLLGKKLFNLTAGEAVKMGIGSALVIMGAFTGIQAVANYVESGYDEKAIMGFAESSLEVGLGAGFIGSKLFNLTAGQTVATGLSSALLVFAAFTGIEAVARAVKTEDCTEEDLKVYATTSLSAGVGTGIMGKKVFELSTARSLSGGVGTALITFGVITGITAVAKSVKAGYITEQSLKDAALSSLGIGAGSAALAFMLGAPLGVAGIIGTLAGVATVGVIVGVAAILTSKKEDLSWGTVKLSDEDIRTYVQQTLFSKDIDVSATIKLVDTVVDAVDTEKKNIRDQIVKIIPTIDNLQAGVDLQNSYARLKSQLFGEDGSGGLMAMIKAYALTQKNVISTGISLVPIINDAGENVSQDFLTSGITGWSGVEQYMSNLGTQLGQLFNKSLDEELTETEKQLLDKLMSVLNNVTKAVTSSQISTDAFADLNIQMADLDKTTFGKAVDYYDQYVKQLTESYRKMYKQEMSSFASLNSFYQAAADAATDEAERAKYQALADEYGAKYKELAENFNRSVAAAVESASGEGKQLIAEAIRNVFGDYIIEVEEIPDLYNMQNMDGETATDYLSNSIWTYIQGKLGIGRERLEKMGFELEDFMPQETMTAILDEIDRVYGSDLSHEIAYSLGQDGWVSEQLRKKAEADKAAALDAAVEKAEAQRILSESLKEKLAGIGPSLVTENPVLQQLVKDTQEALARTAGQEIGKGITAGQTLYDAMQEAMRKAMVEENNNWFKKNQELSTVSAQKILTLEDALAVWTARLELGQRKVGAFSEELSQTNVDLLSGLMEDLKDGVLDSTTVDEMAAAYTLLKSSYEGASESLQKLLDVLYESSGLKAQDDATKLNDGVKGLIDQVESKQAELAKVESEIDTYYKRYGGVSPDLQNRRTNLQNEIDDLLSEADRLQREANALIGGGIIYKYDTENGVSFTIVPEIDLNVTEVKAIDTTPLTSGLEETERKVKKSTDAIRTYIMRMGNAGGAGTVSSLDSGSWLQYLRFAGFRANGGFVGTGDMFIAREAGPEMVGRIGSRTAVANNDQIVAGVANGVAAGQAEQNYLLRQQNEYLRMILAKESTVQIGPSAALGKVVRQSEQMYARNAGG